MNEIMALYPSYEFFVFYFPGEDEENVSLASKTSSQNIINYIHRDSVQQSRSASEEESSASSSEENNDEEDDEDERSDRYFQRIHHNHQKKMSVGNGRVVSGGSVHDSFDKIPPGTTVSGFRPF